MSIPFRLWIRGGCTLFCLSPAACRRDTLRRPQCRSLAQDAAVFLLLVQAPIRRELTFHAGENLCLRRLVRRRQCQVRYTNQMQCHPLVKAQGKRHRCLDSQTATFRGQLGLLPMCVCAMPIFCESGVPSVDPDTAAAIPQRRPVALRSTCMCWSACVRVSVCRVCYV
jgi:hypothetical protein